MRNSTVDKLNKNQTDFKKKRSITNVRSSSPDKQFLTPDISDVKSDVGSIKSNALQAPRNKLKMKGRHSDITSKIEPDGPKIRDDLFKRYTDCFAKTFKDIEWHRAQQENPQCIF